MKSKKSEKQGKEVLVTKVYVQAEHDVLFVREHGGAPVHLAKRDDLNSKSTWERDDLQFPRLLAEIYALDLTHEQMQDLCVSMGLEEHQLRELFERAEDTWEGCQFIDVSRCCVACCEDFPEDHDWRKVEA